MAKTTSDSILGVIRKFELVLTKRAVLADKGYRCQYAIYGNAERHGVDGGLRSLTAFLVYFLVFIGLGKKKQCVRLLIVNEVLQKNVSGALLSIAARKRVRSLKLAGNAKLRNV